MAPQGVLTRCGAVQVLPPTPRQSWAHCNLTLFRHLHPKLRRISGSIRDVRRGSVKVDRLIALQSHRSSYGLNITSIIRHSEISLQGRITLRGAGKLKVRNSNPHGHGQLWNSVPAPLRPCGWCAGVSGCLSEMFLLQPHLPSRQRICFQGPRAGWICNHNTPVSSAF